MPEKLILPDLEDRFLPTSNWENGEFTNPETKHRIHYNYIKSPNNTMGTIIALPGLSEFGEKYIETANFFVSKGFDFFVIDWAYQGRSSRLKENAHKRHSDGYETDISDLDFLIKNIVRSNKSLYMLAHSMGANIGLRYIAEHVDTFNAASFSAPMLGIQALRLFSNSIKIALSKLPSINEHYVFGGSDWNEKDRKSDGTGIFSHDEIRDKVHNAWCAANPILQVGSPTFKWLLESLKSIQTTHNNTAIHTPILMAVAGKEELVDNEAIRSLAKELPTASILELDDAKHEILMEKDGIRNRFLTDTLKLFNQ